MKCAKMKPVQLFTFAMMTAPFLLGACTGSAPTGYKYHKGKADIHSLRSQTGPEIIGGYLFGYENIGRADYRTPGTESVWYSNQPTFDELAARSAGASHDGRGYDGASSYDDMPEEFAVPDDAEMNAAYAANKSRQKRDTSVLKEIETEHRLVDQQRLKASLDDIVARFTNEYGYPSRPVYIKPVGDVLVRYPGVDQALAAAMMRNRWVVTSDMSDNPIVFKYDAMMIGKDRQSIITLEVPEATPKLEYNGVYQIHDGDDGAIREQRAPASASAEPISLLR
jgi:hypothetical protein